MWNDLSGLARATTLLVLMLAGPAWGLNAVQMARLASEAPDTSSIYGYDAAVEGDTAMVGAFGSTHVFHYEQGRWVEIAKLGISGRGIELDGDTAAIRGDDGIHVYTGSGSSWTRQAVLDVHAISGAEDTDLGNFALAGDRLVVAADHSDAADDGPPGAGEQGKAYVFTRTGTRWSLQSRIDVFEANDLRLAVDIDGDTLVVAYTGTVDGVDVYERRGSSWQYQVTLATDDPSGQTFEDLVAIDDDTVMVKVVEGDVEQVFVYTRFTYGWRLSGLLHAQGNQRYAALAATTQTIDDVALDGNVAIVGSAGHSEEERLGGSAYVFLRENGHWLQQQNILAPNPGTGIFVALSGERVVLGGIDRYPAAPYVYQLFPGQEPRLFCPGDVNGDGEADLALLTPEGNVSVKALDRRQISWFPLHQSSKFADAELVPDTDGNGSPELAALHEAAVVAEARDLATGGTTGRVSFLRPVDDPPDYSRPTPLDLEVLSDQSGNGIPELAALVEYPYAVLIRDGLSGDPIRDVELDLPEYRIARDLDAYPPTGSGAEALAVIGDNWAGGADTVDIRDSETGDLRRRIWLGEHGDASSGARQEQVLLADMNGNGAPEVAILAQTEVQLRDTVSWQVLGHVSFDRQFTPVRLLAMPDMSGNGADELVLMGKRLDGTVQRAAIKDSRTGQELGRLWFDRNFIPLDLVDCGDINGNGAAELAVLGQRGANGLVKVVVKDSRTGAVMSRVWF